METEQLLSQLNGPQREAVTYTDGPSLVIAGAGSGKTRVLTYKIAYLLQMGMAPWNILALTFTNKAAGEMKERIGKLVGEGRASRLYMGTFHSIFSHILRIEAESVGYHSNYTIYDESDSRSLLKSIIKEMGLDDKKYKPAEIHSRISKAKNRLILAAQYSNDAEIRTRDNHDRLSDTWKIFDAYQQRLQKANAMDFDDLLVVTYRLFDEHDDIRRKYAGRFSYILVDEYQDTNYVQQQIIIQLTKEQKHVCVVGDDYQSIYGFRGANIDNILDFRQVYPDCRLFKLEQNYRSTQMIVDAANSLMKHNARQIPKDVYSHNDEGEKIRLFKAYSDKEEASYVCNKIQEISHREGCGYSDFAILYRTNSQSRSFEEEMRRRAIPYHIVGGLSFYQRKEIKDIIAYFKLVVNTDDEEAFKRIINYPSRGIGQTSVGKIAASAQSSGQSFWQVINNPVKTGLNVNKGTLGKLSDFSRMIERFRETASSKDAYETGREIIKESGIAADLYSSSDPDARARQENLDELLNGMKDFVDSNVEQGLSDSISLSDYLQEVSLQTDNDSEGDDESRVTLMTIHAAKGLEFPTVFVAGLEENIFPSPMSCDSMRQLEEERRLLYVAMTRAEKHCFFTCARNRFRFGKVDIDVPSRFIRDIDPRYISVEGDDEDERTLRPSWRDGSRGYSNRWQNSKPVATQFMADVKPKITGQRMKPVREATAQSMGKASESKPVSTHGLTEGTRIEHQRFGKGTVLKIEGEGENMKATVQFDNTGRKQLLLKFARFNVIG